MKQAASLLVLATLVAAAKAAWEAPSDGNSWQTLCGDGQNSKFDPSHVCFTSRLDETHYDGSVFYFRGYHNGGHDFVIFEGSRSPVFFQNNHWKIWINYDVRIGGDRSCAAWEVQDLNGNDVKSGVFCHGHQPIALA